MGDPRDYDHLLDATAVASLLGLEHRNSVATYARRYADFPEPMVVRSAGRTRLWDRHDITAWLGQTSTRPRRPSPSTESNRASLIAAARAMMARRPINEISVREIGSAAGVPHTLIYRYFGSKQDLRFAVIDQCLRDLNGAFAAARWTPEEMPELLAAALDQSDAIRVIVFSLVEGDPRATQFRSPPLMGLVAEAIRSRGELAPGGITAETAAAAVAALCAGWVIMTPRIEVATGVDHDPDRLARVMSMIIAMA